MSKKKHTKNTVEVNKTEKNISEKPSFLDNKYVVYGIIIICILVSYIGAINNDFVGWDDNRYVYENQDVLKQNWGRLLRAIYEGNYHPLAMVSLGINAIFSKKAGIFIFTNILFHIANSLLVYIFIKKLTKNNIVVSLFTALLFAIHPMHVESVAWVSERKDVLFSFFFLLSCIYYIKNLETSKKKYLNLSLLMYLLSCLSKGMAVVLPLVLILIDYWYNHKIELKNVFKKWPFFILSILFGLIAINAQAGGDFGGLFLSSYEKSAINNIWGFGDKLLFAGNGFMTYIIKFFIPFNLHHYYAYPIVNEARGGAFYLLPVLTLITLIITILSYKKNKVVFFGLSFFIVTVILVIQILALGNTFMAERYTYLPYIGLGFIFFFMLDKYLSIKQVLIVSCSFAIINIYLTRQHVETWNGTEALLKNSLIYHPENVHLASSLATIYGQSNRLDEAIFICKGPIEKRVKSFKFYEITGNCYYLKKDYNNAVKYLVDGLQFAEDDFSKVLLYDNLNTVYQVFDPIGALKNLDNAIKNTNNVKFLKIRGKSLLDSEQYLKAIIDYDEIEKRGYASDTVYIDRSVAKYNLNDYAGSIKDLELALKINPSNPLAIKNLNIIKSVAK